jgi:hypothetical protein
MHSWAAASAVYFAYMTVVAAVRPRLPPGRRLVAAGVAGVGLAAAVFAGASVRPGMLRDWIVPPALLLLGYWVSGFMFVAPMPRAERALMAGDRRLGVHRIAGAMPRWAAELLEIAYAGVYPVIPIALAVHLLYAGRPDPDRFWTIVLMTDFACFGMLPWVQTRPPRALERRDPWPAAFRRFNLRLLGTASIQVNTFPSGHAAEALACALLSFGAPWPIVAWMFVNAAAISAGAVLGRYHYAADALSGWLVAVVVWMLVS